MIRVLAATLLAAALGVVGGWLLAERIGDDGDAEEEAAALPEGWSTCTNERQGFSVGYPAAWYTDHPAPELACFFFDPRRFEVPRDSDFSGTALEVRHEGTFDEALSGLTDPMFWDLRSRVDAEVGGRRAVRLEAVATGEGLLERGAAVYGYVIDREPNAVAVVTTSTVGIDYEPWKAIVDKAARSLRFFPRAMRAVEGTNVVPPQAGLPEAVARKRAQIWVAASGGDYEGLARLVDPAGFEYTYGGAVPGGPAAFWRRVDQTTDERPVPTLAAILELPFAKQRGIYVWPYAFTRRAGSLSPEEREELVEAIGEKSVRFYEQLGNYLGYRAGIDEKGNWVFYVAGD